MSFTSDIQANTGTWNYGFSSPCQVPFRDYIRKDGDGKGDYILMTSLRLCVNNWQDLTDKSPFILSRNSYVYAVIKDSDHKTLYSWAIPPTCKNEGLVFNLIDKLVKIYVDEKKPFKLYVNNESTIGYKKGQFLFDFTLE